jgi:hypothetical protein
MEEPAAQAIVATYALRMKIEETFRDAKNHRFGWSLRDVRSRSGERLTVLLLLVALGTIAVTLLGFEAERRRVPRAYQANTVSRRVLSHFVLGLALTTTGTRHRAQRPPTRGRCGQPSQGNSGSCRHCGCGMIVGILQVPLASGEYRCFCLSAPTAL